MIGFAMWFNFAITHGPHEAMTISPSQTTNTQHKVPSGEPAPVSLQGAIEKQCEELTSRRVARIKIFNYYSA